MPANDPSPGAPAPSAAAVWTALGTVYLVWGSTYLAIRVTVNGLPPFLSAGLRFTCAAAVLAVVLGIRRPGALRVTPRQAAAAALVGLLLLCGGNGLVVLAETARVGVPSGVAALLVAVVPLLVVVLRAGTGDRPPAATLAGVLVGFGGLVLLVLPGRGVAAPLGGALLVVAAAASWSVGSFLSGRLPLPAYPFAATVYEMAAGGLALLTLAAGTGELSGFDPSAVPARAWAGLAYLLVAGSLVAFTAYVWLLHHAPLTLVSTYAYVNPVVAVALGALLLAEPVGPRMLIGGGIVVAGVALVVSTERPGRRPAPDHRTG
ncbi:MAG TPA: EamA family transporter [Pilimelia sp.]|nr:EamA family transporter [Pilimelia sp.]